MVQVNADEYEIQVLSRIAQFKGGDFDVCIVTGVFEQILSEIDSADKSSISVMKSHLNPWWKTLGNVIEASLLVCPHTLSSYLLQALTQGFAQINASLNQAVSDSGFDMDTKETLSIFTGFNLAYTSAVRATIESLHALNEPEECCNFLIGLESALPLDNKGISNVYKRVRQVEDSSLTEFLATLTSSSDTSMGSSTDDLGVSLEDEQKSFEKYWTLMDVSRKCDPELLTEMKAWGKFSQSSTATLNLMLEQPDSVDSASGFLNDPLEYEPNQASFPIQLSSASFRRRALLNILFTCSYVMHNSQNALIAAAAKTLCANVLKSLPGNFGNAIHLLNRFENHWIAWKSTAHSKEVCGPLEKRSRIERNLEPLGEPAFDLPASAECENTEGTNNSAMSAISTPINDSSMDVVDGSLSSNKQNMVESLASYRQYVKDAILCDISDESEVARLSASDEGMEEAMRNNSDRVLLWQFRRMRFNTDLKSFQRPKPSKGESSSTTPAASPPPEPEDASMDNQQEGQS